MQSIGRKWCGIIAGTNRDYLCRRSFSQLSRGSYLFSRSLSQLLPQTHDDDDDVHEYYDSIWKLVEQSALLEAIPCMNDVQSVWLLLLYCGGSRANYFCRVVDPTSVQEYAAGHDANIFKCLCTILEIGSHAIEPI